MNSDRLMLHRAEGSPSWPESSQPRTPPDGLTEEEFDTTVLQTVSEMDKIVSFLISTPGSVENLAVSCLERLLTVLDRMQVRNHSRSRTVAAALRLFLRMVQDWVPPTSTFGADFFLDRDLDYYLRHANAARLSFGEAPYRLPDLFLILVLEKCEDNPELCCRHLRTILKYGISPDSVLAAPHHLRQAWDGIVLTGCLGSQAVSHFSFCWKDGDAVSLDCRQAARSLLGSVDPVSVPILRKRSGSGIYFDEDSARRCFGESFDELTRLRTQSLQDLCRRLIRRRLHRNWALPHGVRLLDIPTQMKDFLNLET